MTHIIKAEIGLKCPEARLRSAASLQEKTHFALLFFATRKCGVASWDLCARKVTQSLL